MRIGIDIRTLMDARYSGVSEFCYHLLREIFAQDQADDFVLFYNSFSRIEANLPEFVKRRETVNPGWPNKVFNYLLVRSFGRPRLDVLTGSDILYLPHFNFTAVCRAPVIQTVHDLSFWRYPEMFSWRKNVWHYALDVRQQLRRAELIVAVSHSTKADIVELGGIDDSKVKVIYPGLGSSFRLLPDADPEMIRVRQKYNLPESFVLYLGTIEPRKNIEGLIQAYEQLGDTSGQGGPDLVLAGGEGWKCQRIRRAYQESRRRDQIKFLGYVPDGDKRALYNLARIFVYPSFFEGFGFPPLEAMACGTPVIAGANSSLAEVVGDGGLLVNPFDAAELAEAMQALLQNDGLRQAKIEAGLRQSRNFAWSKSAAEYINIFHKA